MDTTYAAAVVEILYGKDSKKFKVFRNNCDNVIDFYGADRFVQHNISEFSIEKFMCIDEFMTDECFEVIDADIEECDLYIFFMWGHTKEDFQHAITGMCNFITAKNIPEYIKDECVLAANECVKFVPIEAPKPLVIVPTKVEPQNLTTWVVRETTWTGRPYPTTFFDKDAAESFVNKLKETNKFISITEGKYMTYKYESHTDPYSSTVITGLERVGTTCDCRGANTCTVYVKKGDTVAKEAALEYIARGVAAFNGYYSAPWV